MSSHTSACESGRLTHLLMIKVMGLTLIDPTLSQVKIITDDKYKIYVCLGKFLISTLLKREHYEDIN